MSTFNSGQYCLNEKETELSEIRGNIVYAIGHISLMLKVGNIVPTFEQQDKILAVLNPALAKHQCAGNKRPRH